MKNPDREHAKKGTQFYTYLHSTLESKPFYVGKGRKERAWVKSQRSDYWNRVVEKHGLVIQIVQFWDTEQEAHDHEVQLIAQYRSEGCQLVNFTDGGEGISGWKHTPEALAKLSVLKKGHKQSAETIAARVAHLTGVSRPPDVIEKIAIANTGKKRSDEAKQKMREAHLGKKVTNYPKMRKSRTVPEGYINPTLGSARPDKVKEKIRQTLTGTKHTEERRAALRAAWVRRKARAQTS